jgi:SAM-dependent methyltransferase
MSPDFCVPSDWYRTFFSEPVMRFWEAAVPQAATDSEVAFVIRHLGAGPPARILDVPCGSGRHALALAGAGFTVTGIDLSEPALARAQARAGSTSAGVCFVCSDMLELALDGAADALICLGNSIGYFEPALTRKLLCRFASVLRPGARLIIDTSICAESAFPLAAQRTWSFPGGSYQQQITYDAWQSVINTRAQLSIEGCTHELHYRHFVMTTGELVRSLEAAGFAIGGLYGDTEDAAFRPGAPRLLLVAARK